MRKATPLSYFIAALLILLVRSAAGDTWELRDLYSFGQRDSQGGRNPADPPIRGADGALYGTTTGGGAFGKGVVYRFQPSDSSYVVVRHFIGGADGGPPIGTAFLQASDGRLYGFAVNPQLILYSLATDGSDYRILFTFPPGAEAGGRATNVPSLTSGLDGLLYGIYMTTNSNMSPAIGTMFRIARDGSGFQILAADMLSPSSPVSFGAHGNLYGVTDSTVYRLQSDGGNFQTIHTFPPLQFGEMQAEGGLVHASNGFIYGVTDRGGSFSFGTIFRLRPDGTEFSSHLRT